MIPKPTKLRLLQLIRLLQQQQSEYITSIDIESISGWKDTTVRKDISYALKSYPIKSASNGYDREELLQAIQKTLQMNSTDTTIKKKCCIIGLSKIAQGLIQSKEFDSSSFAIVAGFDESMNKVETMNAPFKLFVIKELESVIKELHIEYAILDVDDKDAPIIAQRLFLLGIKGIVNYTNAILPVMKTTKVENVSVIAALQNLAY